MLLPQILRCRLVPWLRTTHQTAQTMKHPRIRWNHYKYMMMCFSPNCCIRKWSFKGTWMKHTIHCFHLHLHLVNLLSHHHLNKSVDNKALEQSDISVMVQIWCWGKVSWMNLYPSFHSNTSAHQILNIQENKIPAGVPVARNHLKAPHHAWHKPLLSIKTLTSPLEAVTVSNHSTSGPIGITGIHTKKRNRKCFDDSLVQVLPPSVGRFKKSDVCFIISICNATVWPDASIENCFHQNPNKMKNQFHVWFDQQPARFVLHHLNEKIDRTVLPIFNKPLMPLPFQIAYTVFPELLTLAQESSVDEEENRFVNPRQYLVLSTGLQFCTIRRKQMKHEQ